jgi:hypothetical protein
VSGVVVVAPAEAEWTRQAEKDLSRERLFAARLYEEALLPLLLHSGGVRVVVIDSRLAAGAMRSLRSCLALYPEVKVVLVHESSSALRTGSLEGCAWPSSIEAVRTLLTT